MSAQGYDAEGGVVPRAWSEGRRAGAARGGRVGPVVLWLAVALIVLARMACFSAERAPATADAASARPVAIR